MSLALSHFPSPNPVLQLVTAFIYTGYTVHCLPPLTLTKEFIMKSMYLYKSDIYHSSVLKKLDIKPGSLP